MTLLSILFRLFYMSVVQVIDMKVNHLVYPDVLNMPCHIFCLSLRDICICVWFVELFCLDVE